MSRFLRISKISIILLLMLFLCTTNVYGGTNNKLLDSLETSLGRSAKEQLLEMYGGNYNLPLSDYLFVMEIFERLVAIADREISYSLTILNSPLINAFALPGGHIFMTRGLQKIFANDQHRLAAVLAHEIAHVELKHGLNSMLRQLGLTVLLELGVYYLDLPSSKEMRIATMALVDVVQSGYSREAEMEADFLGQEYLARAGFDPAGGIQMLADLRDLHKEQEQMDIFSTHPLTIDRITLLQNQLLDYWQIVGKPGLDFIDHNRKDPGIDPLGRFVLKQQLNEAGFWEVECFDNQREQKLDWFKNIEARYPTWAPQGNQVAVAVKQQKAWEIWIFNRVGNFMNKIGKPFPGEISNLSFSQDGLIIAYNYFDEDNDLQLMINYLDGNIQLQIPLESNGVVLGWESEGLVVKDEKSGECFLIKPPVLKSIISMYPVPQVIERKARMTPISEIHSDSSITLTRPSYFDF